jgi:hypothetical protein
VSVVAGPARSSGEPGARPQAGAAGSRQESAQEREDRNLAELLQELRVSSLGVQVLFGFLLSLPFTNRFERLDGTQRDLYLTCLVLSAVATTVLLGPVAYHRLVFRRGMKEGLVRFANLMAIIGLSCIGAAVLVAVALLADYVAGMPFAAVVTALLAVLLFTIWLAIPLTRRRAKSAP